MACKRGAIKIGAEQKLRIADPKWRRKLPSDPGENRKLRFFGSKNVAIAIFTA